MFVCEDSVLTGLTTVVPFPASGAQGVCMLTAFSVSAGGREAAPVHVRRAHDYAAGQARAAVSVAQHKTET